jgi:hypothetical protein
VSALRRQIDKERTKKSWLILEIKKRAV